MEEKELLKLIDKYIDEALTVEETEEFNDLLECSKDFRDLFRQRIRLHGDLSNHYDAANVPGITPFEQAPKPNNKPIIFTLLTAVAAILVFAVILNKPQDSKQTELIAGIAYFDEAEIFFKNQKLKVDQLSKGEYHLEKGMIELQMPNDVVLAIEAPADFTIENDVRISLARGKVSANVGEAGRGFEVITPDGKIIDLGTRFGVSVSNTGKTEAHVFEGKINVVANSKVTELVEDQAISLDSGKEAKKISVDQSSFPLPGFPIDSKISNPDFEKNIEFLVGWPKQSMAWGGDHCEMVSEVNGVMPYSGSQMMQFVETFAKGAKNEGQNVSQLWQIIDLKKFRDEVGRGGVTARLSALFNTIENLESDDTSFTISLVAFNGAPDEIKKYWDNKKEPLSELLGQSSHQLRADLDGSTWEKSSLNLQIPAGTDFLLIQLAANSGMSRTLEGHFVDSIKLDISTVPRRSVPIADWSGKAGDWNDKNNWKFGALPDLERDTVRIMGAGEAVIDKEVTAKQSIILATHLGSEGHLKIAPEGILNQSANGELVIGYNEDGTASVLVEGKLRTRGFVFIGRNNAKSLLVIDGGEVDADGSKILMSQFGNRGVDTESLLEIKNGGKLKAKSLNMIHDDSVVELVDGYVELENLKIGGEDGSAVVNHHSGILRTDKLTFGSVDSRYYITGVEAQLWFKGEWTIEQLLNIENSTWVFQGEELKKEQLKVSTRQVGEITYSVFQLR